MSRNDYYYEMEPEPGGAEDQDYAYYYEPEESRWGRNRLLWIGGALGIAVLAALACCVCAVGAFFAGRAVGCATPMAPPSTVSQQPAAPPPASGQQPEATPTIPQPPESVIIFPVEAKVGEEVAFDGSESRPGSSPIASYDWDLGDGNRGSGPTVTHVYQAPGTYQVNLTVTGEDGLSSTGGSVAITILEAEATQPTPTPELPAIQSFTVSPAQTAAGECVDIAWSVEGNISLIEVRRNEELIGSMASAVGQQTDCIDQAGSYVYRLEASGPAGDSVFQEVTVTVTEGEPQENPLADTQWQLSAMNVDQIPLPNTTITASFAGDGTVKGTGGCNDYDGTYIVQGDTLFVGPLASGSESCGDEIDQQEEDYLFALEFADTFEISDSDLIIRDEFAEEVLRFKRQ